MQRAVSASPSKGKVPPFAATRDVVHTEAVRGLTRGVSATAAAVGSESILVARAGRTGQMLKIRTRSGCPVQPSDDSAGQQSCHKGPRVLTMRTPSTLGAEGCVSHPGPGRGRISVLLSARHRATADSLKLTLKENLSKGHGCRGT